MSSRIVDQCLRGHPYDEANTYVTPKGSKNCRQCAREASQRARHGVVTPRPSTEERFWAKVNKTATCWLWTSAHNDKGYASFHLDGRARFAHRVAYEWLVGPIPEGLFLDHVCHVPDCVNPSHLRPVTNKQNMEHRKGPNKGSTSGVRGVTQDKRTGNWVAVVGHNNKRHRIGTFHNIADAEAAVIAKRNELFTHHTTDGAQAA